MNRDEIIRMAREAGLEEDDSLVLEPEVIWYIGLETLERFAALVAAAAKAEEREACAKVCDATANNPNEWAYERSTAEELAEAIRARGQE